MLEARRDIFPAIGSTVTPVVAMGMRIPDAVVGVRPRHRDIGHAAVRDPFFLLVKDPITAVGTARVVMAAGWSRHRAR